VVTYNVRSLRDDSRAVTRVLRNIDPDLVSIQQAPHRVAPDPLDTGGSFSLPFNPGLVA
jgi:hypothetical protein